MSIFSRDILVSGDFIISVSDATHADDRLQVPTSDDIKRRSDVNGVRNTCQQGSAKLLAAKMPEISVRTIEAYFELSCLSQHDFKLCVLCR